MSAMTTAIGSVGMSLLVSSGHPKRAKSTHVAEDRHSKMLQDFLDMGSGNHGCREHVLHLFILRHCKDMKSRDLTVPLYDGSLPCLIIRRTSKGAGSLTLPRTPVPR